MPDAEMLSLRQERDVYSTAVGNNMKLLLGAKGGSAIVHVAPKAAYRIHPGFDL
jgi:hypothetical protein